jgi:DnaJ-class molecular chaperone
MTPPAKTCPHCMGRHLIIVNAGTGLTKPCQKCQTPNKITKADNAGHLAPPTQDSNEANQ